jgi:hypothetical protein
LLIELSEKIFLASTTQIVKTWQVEDGIVIDDIF